MKLSVTQIVQAWLDKLSPTDARVAINQLEALQLATNKQSVRLALLDPLAKGVDRTNLLAQAGFSKPVRELVRWLAEHRMLGKISSVATQAQILLERRDGAMPASIFSAVDLSEQEQADIKSALHSKHGELSSLTFAIDKRVIGGLVVKVGSLRTDLSVRGKLERVRQVIMTS